MTCNMNNIDFSVIIPHRNSLRFLPKLFSSIPESDKIEVILVDNSPTPVTKEQIIESGVKRNFELLYSAPLRGAGGARNEGIEHATGKWLLFLDADDYFADGAFNAFYKHLSTKADIVYFSMGGIYEDTGERANRGDNYTNLVKGYLDQSIDELTLRLQYSSPCAKMVRRELVEKYDIRYDEVIASNDTYFSMLTGYYAKTIEADPTEVYIATVSKGSLTRRRDLAVVMSRYKVALRYNKFLKEHKLSKYQKSVMLYLYNACSYGLIALLKMLGLAIKYRQNLFVGASRWRGSMNSKRQQNAKESQYITK